MSCICSHRHLNVDTHAHTSRHPDGIQPQIASGSHARPATASAMGVVLLQGRRLHAEQFLQVLGPLPTSGVLHHQASLVRLIQPACMQTLNCQAAVCLPECMEVPCWPSFCMTVREETCLCIT